MLHYYHGVAQLLQTAQHAYELLGVARVEAYAGLIEYVEGAYETAAEGGGYADALALAAAEGGGGAAEGEVA